MAIEIMLRHLEGSSLYGHDHRFAQERVRLGTGPDNDVVFDAGTDAGVAVEHAELYVEGGAVWIRDLGSGTGTFVDDRPIDQPLKLSGNELLSLGREGPRGRVLIEESLVPASKAPPAPERESAKHFVGKNTLRREIRKATAQEERRNRRIVRELVTLIAVIVLGGLGAFYLYNRSLRSRLDEVNREKQELGEELEKEKERVGNLMGQLHRVGGTLETIRNRQDLSEEDRRRLLDETEEKLSALRKALSESERELQNRIGMGGTLWADIAARYKDGIFLCLGFDEAELIVETGTAFCVREDGLLATNAHVVRMLENRPKRKIVQNGTGRIFEIERMIGHPDFNDVFSPDVGLIEIKTEDAEIPALPLADEAALSSLRIGTQLVTLGFPGELTPAYVSKDENAIATFKDGWIGRLTNYELEPPCPGDPVIIQHSASLSGGTSGSPMFTAKGTVVALNNGGHQERSAEIGFAIRADELKRFMEKCGW